MVERARGEFHTSRVRELSHRIINRTKVLSINEDVVRNDLVKALSELQESKGEGVDLFANNELTPENELGLNLFVNVVNFCYMDPVSREEYVFISKSGKNIRRFMGLKSAMAESGVNWGDIWEVSNLTTDKWAEITQLGNNKEFFLGAERGKRIALFANKLFSDGFDDVSQLIDYSDLRSDSFLSYLTDSGFFTDEFEKRSQLTVSMLNGVLHRRYGMRFLGTDDLSVMADYRLPQVMYNFGAIELSEGLLAKLKSGSVIESGSEEERSLRAASVVVGETLSDLMHIPENEVDSLLWTLSKKTSMKIPHMLVATDKY